MISALQGRFLALLSGLVRPTAILELGAFTGYSALCLLEGSPRAQLVTCDIDLRALDVARRYFEIAGVTDRVDLEACKAEIAFVPLMNCMLKTKRP